MHITYTSGTTGVDSFITCVRVCVSVFACVCVGCIFVCVYSPEDLCTIMHTSDTSGRMCV